MLRRDAPTDDVELAIAWLENLWTGQADKLDWLTTRTCQIDLSAPEARVEPLDRASLVALADLLGTAFSDVELSFGTVHQREHEISVDGSLQATHSGPLDLTPWGGARYPATGRRLELIAQRWTWHILHKRVHGFEVQRGSRMVPARLLGEVEHAVDRRNTNGGPRSEAHSLDPDEEARPPGADGAPDTVVLACNPTTASPANRAAGRREPAQPSHSSPGVDDPERLRRQVDTVIEEQE